MNQTSATPLKPPVVLHTARLLLRPLRRDDIPALLPLIGAREVALTSEQPQVSSQVLNAGSTAALGRIWESKSNSGGGRRAPFSCRLTTDSRSSLLSRPVW